MTGMAGVYDIARHYEYEKGRGVAFLSTMERAIGGQDAFSSQSPAQLINGADSSWNQDADYSKNEQPRARPKQTKTKDESYR